MSIARGILVNMLILVFCSSFSVLKAQDIKDRDTRIGVFLGYGGQKIGGVDIVGVDYHYQMTVFQVEYHYRFLDREKWSLNLLTQGQFNISSLGLNVNTTEFTQGFEFGIQPGLLIRRKRFLLDNIEGYAMLSIGPHYVSKTPDRQAKGFIFSDNIFLGLNIAMTNALSVDFRPGYRHISNANLRLPNGGVNTILLFLGLNYQL